MKFQFKEGQWFNVRKLTDWQKQWCLENLDILSPSETDFEKGRFNFWMYSVWTGIGDVFCSTSDHCCEPENEITFNDLYWEGEESFDNLVYVEPKHIDNDTYYVVEKDKLSEDQWEFLLGNVPLEYEPEDNEIYLNLDPDDRKWFGDTYKSGKQDIYVSFNDLFQEVK